MFVLFVDFGERSSKKNYANFAAILVNKFIAGNPIELWWGKHWLWSILKYYRQSRYIFHSIKWYQCINHNGLCINSQSKLILNEHEPSLQELDGLGPPSPHLLSPSRSPCRFFNVENQFEALLSKSEPWHTTNYYSFFYGAELVFRWFVKITYILCI